MDAEDHVLKCKRKNTKHSTKGDKEHNKLQSNCQKELKQITDIICFAFLHGIKILI